MNGSNFMGLNKLWLRKELTQKFWFQNTQVNALSQEELEDPSLVSPGMLLKFNNLEVDRSVSFAKKRKVYQPAFSMAKLAETFPFLGENQASLVSKPQLLTLDNDSTQAPKSTNSTIGSQSVSSGYPESKKSYRQRKKHRYAGRSPRSQLLETRTQYSFNKRTSFTLSAKSKDAVSCTGNCCIPNLIPSRSEGFSNNMEAQTEDFDQNKLKLQMHLYIIKNNEQISFEEIAGNQYAKDVIKESFVTPSLFPQLYQGTGAKPWRSILLYGPPGVGKTMLTSSVARHSKMTCFWFSLEKNFKKSQTEMDSLLSSLLEVAKEHAPSVILLEEFDSMGRKRTSSESEQDRRMKNSFYKMMDEINRCPEWISVFATTSIPWDLDVAALRRFQRKVLVPMPNKEDRISILKIHSGTNHTLDEKDFEQLGKMTEGFSGSDISIIVNEALMRPIKEVSQVDEFVKVPRIKITEYDQKMGIGAPEELKEEESYQNPSSFVWIPKLEGHPLLETSSMEAEVKKVGCMTEDPSISENIFIRNPEMADFKASIANCKPTVPQSAIELYQKFLETYGHKEQKDLLKEEKPYFSYYA